ncbi:uncharacterized protein LOC115884578 [Sitophilus oryzae]|uniref:Uncharacterized protein LOC115884578 n=1 Tax=Sitophilus oryzae TaxID=7048 RepID=A0A6J2Y7W3_SITOR|nr:uncharacterized protein LOC115884578 [Sitophilus oryzae]
MTYGFPQGSMLGPTLWNIFYDQILRTDTGLGNTILAYADDLVLLITALITATYTILEEKIQTAALAIKNKLESMGVKLAPEMTSHVTEIRDKTTGMIQHLTRITPNIGGPRAEKRLLASVLHSTILYASAIWDRSMRFKHYENMLERINRKLALRVASAYCTCPTVAVLCLAKIPPVSLLNQERNQIYKNETSFRKKARNMVLEQWQTRWEAYSGWTKTFIPNIKDWIECDQANTDYYITQAITGHEVFGEYLHRICKPDSPTCWYCDVSDTANHTLFVSRARRIYGKTQKQYVVRRLLE